MWKYKGFSLINIGGLAIGLACCLILLLYVEYEYGYDRQAKDYKRTYVAYTNSKANGKVFSWAWTPGLLAPELKAKYAGITDAARASYPQPKLISYNDTKVKNAGMFIDPYFLKILDYKFIDGNADKVLQDINTVVITKSLAQKLFGSENPINKVVKLDNADPLKVEGVIEDVAENSTIKFDYLMPWKLYEKREDWIKRQGWGSNYCLTVVQLQNSDLADKINNNVKGIYKQKDDNSNELYLHPLSKWHLYDEFENGRPVGGKINQLRILMMLSICILLIACVNFMNLSTARSEKRAKEVGIRKAMGSSRKVLMSQFILESLLISFLATLIAFVLIEISLPYFNTLLNINLIIKYNEWQYWIILSALMLFTGLIAGSYPAFYLSSFEPVKVLKGFKINVGSSFSVRRVLVVFQFVFAVCLIVFTAVIYQQLNYIKNKPIGYDNDNLIQLTAQGELTKQPKIDLLKNQLLKSGVVKNVSTFSMQIDAGGNNTSDISWKGKDPRTKILFNFRAIGEDFVQTVGAKMIEGRMPSTKLKSDSNNVVFNETAIKVMGLKNPVGKVIKYGDDQCTIVGVMKDFVVESPYQKVAPMIFYCSSKDNVAMILVKLHPSGNITSSLSKIDEIVKSINPNYSVDRKFVSETFEEKYENEKLLSTLSTWFGGFAIFISCLGLLGLALFMAEQRKKEISIRKVLGASTGNILTLLNKDFIKLVAIANIIAFPIAYVVINQWLSTFDYRVAISFLPFALAIVISVVIAILTVSIQSIKVAKANPIDALKYE